jgi:bifunctional non-homologous end joining protein LigD
MADGALFTIAGQEFKVTSPERVFYPATGTTKLDVIGYYAEASTAMLPHLVGRPATRKRWPEGVDKTSFFVKDLEAGTPGWLTRVQIRHGSGPKFYPVFDSPAALAWLGQVAALELHVPQWRIEPPAGPTVTSRSAERHPDRVVFDLDPGPGAGLAECVDVALALRERLGPLGQRVAVATSGSKGLHLYVPMDHPISSAEASEWARLAAEKLQKALPALVVSRMAKSLRSRKVLVDWSQLSLAA